MAYGISFIQVIKGTDLQGLYTPLHVLYVGMRISHSVSKVIPRERSYIYSNQTFGVVHVTCMYIVSVKSKLQPLPPPPSTQAYPTHLKPLPSQGGGNLIISQPFKLLASQLHVNNQSVCLSVKKPFKQ